MQRREVARTSRVIASVWFGLAFFVFNSAMVVCGKLIVTSIFNSKLFIREGRSVLEILCGPFVDLVMLHGRRRY